MSNLISGKEALIALANGEEVELQGNLGEWGNAGVNTYAIGLFLNDCYKFRLKPKTITLNGIEIPAPFEPKTGDKCFIIDTSYEGWFREIHPSNVWGDSMVWDSEEKIKEVVEVLRSIFKGA